MAFGVIGFLVSVVVFEFFSRHKQCHLWNEDGGVELPPVDGESAAGTITKWARSIFGFKKSFFTPVWPQHEAF
jgi:hypothetical protein